MSPARVLVRFCGPAECRIETRGPLGLTLAGRGHDDVPVQVAWVCRPPRDVPPRLDSPLVERTGSHDYVITSGRTTLTVDAARVFVHRDVTRAFQLAVPARRAPLAKRAFWRVVLALAATGIGQRALSALRRRSAV